MKWLTRLCRSHDISNAVALARYYHRLGLACARRGDDESMRRSRQIRDARLWEARQLSR